MTDKELKRLSRSELLEELYAYANNNVELQLRVDNMSEEIQQLRLQSDRMLKAEQDKNYKIQQELNFCKEQNRELTVKLRRREIELEDAGNIADATLKMTGIFEVAQKTADLYLQNVRVMAEKQEKMLAALEEKNRQEIQKMGDEATRTCLAMRNQTERDCAKQKADTEKECQRMRAEAIRMAEDYWDKLSGRLEEFYLAHKGMQELFAGSGIRIPKFPGIK